MNTVSVSFYRADDSCFGVLSNVTLVGARISANEVLRTCEFIAKAVILGDDIAEVMYPEEPLNPYFPLADVANLPRVPHTPMDRLARHFQMAGAVDQGTIEQLAFLMRGNLLPNPVARAKAGTIRFLCRDGCTNTIRTGASDAELDAYRNSNQY